MSGPKAEIKMQKPAEFRVEEITGTNFVPLTYELRYRVWANEVPLIDSVHAAGVICDEHEAHSRHWGAFSSGGTLVASARLCIHDTQQYLPEEYCYTELDLPTPIASINRLVVEQSARNRGIAKQLDLQRIEAAKNAGAACIVAYSTNHRRIKGLGKLGFAITRARCKCSYEKDSWASVMVLGL
jgi:GNAT superfamily N-acetyltransferase